MSRVMTIAPEALGRRLGDYLEETRGDDRPVSIVGRLSGGWSVDTYHVRVGPDELVLRIAGAEHPMRTNAAREARVMAAAEVAAVPVPRVVAAEDDPDWLGAPFALVAYVRGDAPNVWSRRAMSVLLGRVSAEELLRRLVDLALRIPAIPLASVEDALPSTLGLRAAEYTVAADVERWLALLDETSRPRPVLALAGRWLAANAPESRHVVLQHHDFRLGNVLFGSDGAVNAVLDWEFAGAGDALCDIGYAAQPYCLGRLLRRQAALALRPDPTSWVLREYAERSPRAEGERLRYFVALGIYKMAVALVLPADTWSRGGGLRDAWLELPILSLTEDLLEAVRAL
jgi:aminoglycoside phosphotransferase (APT) family kinase protein